MIPSTLLTNIGNPGIRLVPASTWHGIYLRLVLAAASFPTAVRQRGIDSGIEHHQTMHSMLCIRVRSQKEIEFDKVHVIISQPPQ